MTIISLPKSRINPVMFAMPVLQPSPKQNFKVEKFSFICTLLLLILAVDPARADNSGAQQFNIPAGELSDALLQYSEASGRKILVNAELVNGLQTNGVRGNYSGDQALRHLLSGSGLIARETSTGSLTVEKQSGFMNVADTSSAQSTDGETLPKVTVEADADNPYKDPNWTNDPNNTDYNRPNALSATKTDKAIMDTPLSIQVVPQQILKDQQVIRMNRAAENVSGVYRGSFGGDMGVDHFIIRGFQSDQIYRNGVPYESSSFISNEEAANVERIEVLKGPASTLYGRAEPGGIVNMITKQPLSTPYYSFQQQFGSFNYYRTSADATGPINDDKSLLYRFNGAFETRDSFRKYSEGESIFLAPSFRWNISDQTQANLEFQYRHNSDPFTYGWPAIGNRPARLPRDTNISGPYATNLNSESYVVDFNWSHAFNDQWTLSHQFNMQRSDANQDALVYSLGLRDDNRTLDRGVFPTKNALSERFYNTVNLTGKFDTWGLDHTLLMGGDYMNYNLSGEGFSRVFNSPIDIFNPVETISPGSFEPSFTYDNHTDWWGLYLQDQIQLPLHFELMAGLRYDNVVSKDNTIDADTESADRVTPRVGLTWRPLNELSFFGNYLENFGAQNFGNNRSGATLPPVSAQQWEFGVKTELLDGRLTGSLTYYDLTKQNTAIPDPLDQSGSSSIAIGEVNNSGVELDLSGEILPGWNMIGSYSYIDSEITKDIALITDDDGNVIGSTDGNTGNRLANVPRHGGNLWTTYEFLEGDLKGLKFGAGMQARSQRQGDNEGSFQVPGYVTMNMLV
ncbi:MAG: TonB-dependent receptor [Methylococcaceae bacterium]|nr:TonB-dependent receptor [Methylococcaceae bacterium]